MTADKTEDLILENLDLVEGEEDRVNDLRQIIEEHGCQGRDWEVLEAVWRMQEDAGKELDNLFTGIFSEFFDDRGYLK